MFKILEKKRLNAGSVMMTFDAPFVARRAKPGQFVILMTDDAGERMPFTIAGSDADKGTVTIIFQVVGAGTGRLDQFEVGQSLPHVVGPLGKPSQLSHLTGKHVVLVAGGLGVAIIYPQAKALKKLGAKVTAILGFRSQEQMLLVDEMTAASDHLILMTDDGTGAPKGLVTDGLKQLMDSHEPIDEVIAIGPLPMMKAVSVLTKAAGIKTVVSMNATMVDGTGMCGGCRLTVGGQTVFACVDGPEFDGHLVDFDEAIARGRYYRQEEGMAHACRLEDSPHDS